MSAPSPTAVFVYGTLKRGLVRERLWPRVPLSVAPAWILGRLYDLGPYPALVAGTDRILGELWRFVPQDLPATLRVLDRIEGFASEPGDLYQRGAGECTTEAGEVVAVWSYRYARELPADARPIAANASGFCQWP